MRKDDFDAGILQFPYAVDCGFCFLLVCMDAAGLSTIIFPFAYFSLTTHDATIVASVTGEVNLFGCPIRGVSSLDKKIDMARKMTRGVDD